MTYHPAISTTIDIQVPNRKPKEVQLSGFLVKQIILFQLVDSYSKPF